MLMKWAIPTILAVGLTVGILGGASAAGPGLIGPTIEIQNVSSIAARRCPACRILCRKGFVCRCNKCVRSQTLCRPHNIMCKKGYTWKCNGCVPISKGLRGRS
jgi:hypothetical protein